MGSVFRPKYKDMQGRVHQSRIWWLKYYRDGRPNRESTGSAKVTVAREMLSRCFRDSSFGWDRLKVGAL